MDFLYDKVGFYDSVRGIMAGTVPANALVSNQEELTDIADNMLHFLENHDEQRIASPQFAGDPNKGKPANGGIYLNKQCPNHVVFCTRCR